MRGHTIFASCIFYFHAAVCVDLSEGITHCFSSSTESLRGLSSLSQPYFLYDSLLRLFVWLLYARCFYGSTRSVLACLSFVVGRAPSWAINSNFILGIIWIIIYCTFPASKWWYKRQTEAIFHYRSDCSSLCNSLMSCFVGTHLSKCTVYFDICNKTLGGKSNGKGAHWSESKSYWGYFQYTYSMFIIVYKKESFKKALKITLLEEKKMYYNQYITSRVHRTHGL